MSFDLRLGDCIEGMKALADKSVDVTLTDPPYSQHVHSKSMRGANGWRGEISIKRDLGFEAVTMKTIVEVSAQLGRLTRRWIAVFSDVESCHLWRKALVRVGGVEYVRTCEWQKIAGAPQLTGDRPAVGFEAITLAHVAGKKRWNGGGKAGTYRHAVVAERGDGTRRYHTAQKPEALMTDLVRDFTDPGDLILDPFAGSGTTGVAAIRLGRRFIGFERDEKYHAIALKRLTATREQLGLFAEGA